MCRIVLKSAQATESRLGRLDQQLLDEFQQCRHFDGFFDERSDTGGSRHVVLVRHGRDNDDGHVRLARRQVFENVPTAFRRQIQIQQNQVDLLWDEPGFGLTTVARQYYRVAGSLQDSLDRPGKGRIIIDYKYFFHHGS